MNFKKLKTKRVIVWGSTSLGLVALLTAANIVMRGLTEPLLNQIFGGKRPIIAEREPLTFNKQQAYENGNKVTEKICEEGMILLKNEGNALPLKANAKVTVFGKNSVNLVYGGSGSAAPDKDGERKTIFDSLTAAGIEYNQTLVDFYKNNSKSGDGRSENPKMENSGVTTLKTGETPISSYTSDVTDSYSNYGDAALVVFSRIAGENWDLPRKAEDNASRTYLDLDNNERDLLKHIVDSGKFQHVVVLMNGSNYIDLGFLKKGLDGVTADKIDACINIGSPGGSGIMALGKILTGAVNPSGHTVDLVYTNYKADPTYQNFGGNENGNDSYRAPNGTSDTDYHVVEYEENIYMGYRYYETRGKDNESWYNENVVYPFGYGLSYTTFSQEILDKSSLNGSLKTDKDFEVEVKVKNTGAVAGKEVVQLYVEAPYVSGKIEKPYKVLCAFGKTKLLEPGEEDTVKLTVTPYYFASFDNSDANGDGFKGYTLDDGDYVFHLGKDSHNDIDTFTKHLSSIETFEKDPTTGTVVKPLFDDVSFGTKLENGRVIGGMRTNLSRSSWDTTFPKTITDEERTASAELIALLDAYESGNKDEYNEFPTMGSSDEYLKVELSSLVGLDYVDPQWNAFLDQLSFEEMLSLFNLGCYETGAIVRTIDGEDIVVVPGTTSADGPTGLVSFLGNIAPGKQAAVYGCCYYCSECLVAQTYNLKLADEQASAIGDEALVGNERDENGIPYSGWYAPGVNLHRSPFSGRNTEYYSEDPLLCGKFAAQVIRGVQDKGVYANVKHFALNDQETHRSTLGIATWCDEQAIREMYLRPFEIAVKEGKSKGLMTSFNRIGTTWAGGDYRLCTTILRNEWGFQGSVICDFHTDAYMDSKQMLYAGGDLNLCSLTNCQLQIGSGAKNVSPDNAKDCNLLRNASHNLLYSLVNSNIMTVKVVGYKNAIWANVLTGVTIGIGVGIIGWGAWAIISSLLKKETGDAAAEAVSKATGETKTK